MQASNVTTHVTRRSPKTKTISFDNEVRWHFKYAEPSEESEKKLNEVAQVLLRFGAENRFFEDEISVPPISIPSLVCKSVK